MSAATPRRTHSALSAILATLIATLVVGTTPLTAFGEDPPLSSPSPSPVAPLAPVAPSPIPPPGPVFATGPIPLTDTVTFYGRGSGHGVGLSQWGARGRALAGQDAATILAHYYANTTLALIDPATPVRVLLVSGFVPTATRPASVVGVGGPWSVDGLGGPFPSAATLTLLRTGGVWLATVTAADATVLVTAATTGDLRVRPAAPETRLQVTFGAGSYNVYRGVIRLFATTRVTAINEMAMDDYLLGVVPVEMSYLWPTEALKAQSIAARTYALRRLHPTLGRWDVYDDSRSQVYRGVKGERGPVTAAVAATAGQVLMVGSTVANTPFHSADGGATENNELVWTRSDGTVVARPSPELRGSSDRAPDGTPYDAASTSATWKTATYTLERFSAITAADPRTNVGFVTAIDLSRRGVSGRVIAVTLIGTAGTKIVSGSLFRAIFNARRPAGHPLLRSTLIDLVPIS